jgi:hypothetical protein
MKLKLVTGVMLTLLLLSLLTMSFRMNFVEAQEPYVEVRVDQPL